MGGIKILGTGRYLPEKTVCNSDFAAIVDTTDEWITTRTGMRQRHIASHNEPTWYMGAKAAKEALSAAGLCAEKIDMILVTSVSPDFATPSLACIIQGEIGAVNAFAFDINAACAGFAYALDMARRYLMTGDVQNALIVSAESLTQLVNYSDRSTCVLFGDGAGACVVTGSGKRFASYLHSDAAAVNLIYSKKIRTVTPLIPSADTPLEPFEVLHGDGIYMNGREVYKLTTKAMPDAVTKACSKLGLAPADLKLIIPHQANARIIETAVKNLEIPHERVYVNIQDYGNTSSASIPIALDECVRAGRLQDGDLACVVGFGAGFVYGACVFEY